MQRERSALDSFPEPIDLNQGSLPSNTSMDRSPSWGNMLNPVENRFSSYSSAANDHAQSFSGWDRGESSSSANNVQDGEDSKTRLGWSSSFHGSDVRSESWSFEPSNISTSSYGRPPSMHNYSSNRGSLNISSSHGHVREHDLHRGLPHCIYKSSDHSEMEQIPAFYASSSNVGTSSGNTSNSDDVPGPSLSTWGSSCKRKALEGTAGQFYPGGSSSSNQPMEKNLMQLPVPGCYTAPGNLTISSGPLNLSPTNHSEQLNPIGGTGTSRVAPGFFPSSSVAESSARNFNIRSNQGRHETVAFDTPRGTSSRNFGVHAAHLSRDSSELRSAMTLPMNPNNTSSQPHLMPLNEVRGMHSYLWNGSFGSRGGSSSSSFMAPGEREVNVRSTRRNNLEYPMTIPAPEAPRSVLQDQIDWSFAPGTSASSRNNSSGSRVGPTSGGRPSSSAWLPHQSQRVSEGSGAGWIPFPRVESESGNRRSHFALLPSASLDEAATTSRAQRQLEQRSSAFLMDMPGDDITGWRAAVEGRHRLIRQVLNAMRRGAHLQAEELTSSGFIINALISRYQTFHEDYMLIDPFINGFAELHDRHRDMRLDVDNMSYEELLALEEQIGNVNTGLSEEKISGSLKQRKHDAIGCLPNMEPCCICQEDYVTGDDIGILDCGHEFHTSCIKQWLTLKNLCPICKMKALET